MRFPRPTRGAVADLALAAALAVFCLLTAPLIGAGELVGRPVGPAAVLLMVVACAAVAVRRSLPVLAASVAAIATGTYLVLGYPYGPVMLTLAVTVYSVARHGRTVPAALTAVLTFAVLLVHTETNPAALPIPVGLLAATAWVVVPFTVGLARRLVVEAAQRTRAEVERRLVDAERLRLAQEVHDIVGHGLAAIQMQADVALHLRDARPEEAHRALETISRSSADALAELRATLDQIGLVGRAESPAQVPTPGLARVEELCERIRQAGVAVDLQITGEARSVPAAVDVAGYRILQEALTNVVKHSADRRASVALTYQDEAVELTVRNPHQDTTTSRDGYGLPGMARRADSVDGRFNLRQTGSEFVVHAVLPAPPARQG